jgi:hypothetical protein
VFYGIREILEDADLCEHIKISPGIKGKTFIIQGYGNVNKILNISNLGGILY